MVPSRLSRAGAWGDAPPWPEFCCSTACLMGLLLHWAGRLDQVSRLRSGLILKRWLGQSLPSGELEWWASTEPSAVLGGPMVER